MSVIPWSYSTYEAYHTCPRAFYEIKIAKNYVEDKNKSYLLWGNAVHNALEKRVGEGLSLPENMQQWEPLAVSLVAAPGDKYCELQTAVTAALQPTGFWDADAWSRGKEDIVIVNGSRGLSIDYKTGKRKTDTQQLKASAGRVFAMFPAVEVLTTAYAWLGDSAVKWDKAQYTRADIPKIWDEFRPRVAEMEWSVEHNAWPAKPSGLCKKSRKPGSTYGGCIVASCPHSEYYKR